MPYAFSWLTSRSLLPLRSRQASLFVVFSIWAPSARSIDPNPKRHQELAKQKEMEMSYYTTKELIMDKEHSEFNTLLSLNATEIKGRLKVATCQRPVIGWNAERLSGRKSYPAFTTHLSFVLLVSQKMDPRFIRTCAALLTWKPISGHTHPTPPQQNVLKPFLSQDNILPGYTSPLSPFRLHQTYTLTPPFENLKKDKITFLEDSLNHFIKVIMMYNIMLESLQNRFIYTPQPLITHRQLISLTWSHLMLSSAGERLLFNYLKETHCGSILI